MKCTLTSFVWILAIWLYVGVRYLCLGTSMGTNFSNVLAFGLGNVLWRKLRTNSLGNVLWRKLLNKSLGNVLLRKLPNNSLGNVLWRKLPKNWFLKCIQRKLPNNSLGNVLWRKWSNNNNNICTMEKVAVVVVGNCQAASQVLVICQIVVQQWPLIELDFGFLFLAEKQKEKRRRTLHYPSSHSIRLEWERIFIAFDVLADIKNIQTRISTYWHSHSQKCEKLLKREYFEWCSNE